MRTIDVTEYDRALDRALKAVSDLPPGSAVKVLREALAMAKEDKDKYERALGL